MSLVGMLNFYGFAAFLCLTSVLTSTIANESTTTDNTIRESTLFTDHVSLRKDIKLATLPAGQSSKSSSTKDTHNVTVPVEAGNIYMTEGSVLSTVGADPLPENASTQRLTMTEQRNSTRTEIKTKIVPRKGADQSIHREEENVLSEKTTDNIITKPVPESSTTTESINEQPQTTKSSMMTSNINTSSIQLKATKSDDKEHVSLITSAPEKQISVSETPRPTHKPKPTLTIGGPGKDKPIRITPTKITLTSVPRKIDYIVPIVITVVALPLLAAMALVMYRRGRDCWDKRHYRRMDFLIDGMYND